MRYLPLGPTGVLVSELCLGTMTFGEGWGFGGIDEAMADTVVGKAMEAGVNFLDTADMYSEGNSEILLGKALEQGRAAQQGRPGDQGVRPHGPRRQRRRPEPLPPRFAPAKTPSDASAPTASTCIRSTAGMR